MTTFTIYLCKGYEIEVYDLKNDEIENKDVWFSLRKKLFQLLKKKTSLFDDDDVEFPQIGLDLFLENAKKVIDDYNIPYTGQIEPSDFFFDKSLISIRLVPHTYQGKNKDLVLTKYLTKNEMMIIPLEDEEEFIIFG